MKVVCCSDSTWMKCGAVGTTWLRCAQCAAVKATVGSVCTSGNTYKPSGAGRGMHASVQEACIGVYASV